MADRTRKMKVSQDERDRIIEAHHLAKLALNEHIPNCATCTAKVLFEGPDEDPSDGQLCPLGFDLLYALRALRRAKVRTQ